MSGDAEIPLSLQLLTHALAPKHKGLIAYAIDEVSPVVVPKPLEFGKFLDDLLIHANILSPANDLNLAVTFSLTVRRFALPTYFSAYL